MTITVRAATPDDTRFIETLGVRTAAASVSALRPVPDSAAARSFRRLLDFCRAQPDTFTLIAESDAQPAGFVLLLTGVRDDVTQQPQAFIAYMAVERQLRRSGVGRALLGAAQAHAEKLALPHLSLMVTADNAAARDLYRSFGFELERLLLTKRLTPA